MHIAILSIATLLVAVWVLLLGRVSASDFTQASDAKIFDNHIALGKLAAKEKAAREKLGAYSGAVQEYMKYFFGNSLRKKTEKLNRETLELQKGKYKSINTFIMPGFVLQREIEAIGKSGFRKTILTKSFELYGKKHAACKTSQILAKMLSYPIIGVACTLILGDLLLAAEKTSVGMGIIGIGTGLVLVLAYGLYDELSDLTNRRRKAISKQFPNVISKLALLVTSGMIMDRAWKETAYSQDLELYIEMRKTSEELDNLVSPEMAYAGFISRCNTKETAKLASAIMQNQSKGNAEIGRLLKDMAREVWQERRHTAKRDAEKANSKLMIPTMLLFLAILVILMVPIAMNFSGGI